MKEIVCSPTKSGIAFRIIGLIASVIILFGMLANPGDYDFTFFLGLALTSVFIVICGGHLYMFKRLVLSGDTITATSIFGKTVTVYNLNELEKINYIEMKDSLLTTIGIVPPYQIMWLIFKDESKLVVQYGLSASRFYDLRIELKKRYRDIYEEGKE